MSENKKLRVWHNINGVIQTTIKVNSVEQAMKVINQLTEEDLNNPAVEFNAFGLEEYDEEFAKLEPESDGWCEYYDNDGNDILEIMDNLAEE